MMIQHFDNSIWFVAPNLAKRHTPRKHYTQQDSFDKMKSVDSWKLEIGMWWIANQFELSSVFFTSPELINKRIFEHSNYYIWS